MPRRLSSLCVKCHWQMLSMNRPLSRPSATLSPPCGERAGRGVPIWFMVPMHAQNRKRALHERPPHPSLSPSEGERVPEGRVRGRFMAPMRDSETVEASHEPRGTSTLRRKPLPVLALGLTLLMPGCGIRNSTDNPAKENLQASSSTRTVFDLASHSFDPFDAAGAKAIVFL